MKKLIIGFLTCSILYSCLNDVKVAENRNCNVLQPNLRMYKLLDSFISVNGKNNSVNEIYIDKKSPHESDLIIYTGNVSLTADENRFNNQYSVNEAIISDVHFMIYSGVEKYFSLTRETTSVVNNNKSSKEIDLRSVWVVRDSGKIFKIEKNEYAYPFLPFPNKTEGVKFKYPSIK